MGGGGHPGLTAGGADYQRRPNNAHGARVLPSTPGGFALHMPALQATPPAVLGGTLQSGSGVKLSGLHADCGCSSRVTVWMFWWNWESNKADVSLM
jgi:hypothetical protein